MFDESLNWAISRKATDEILETLKTTGFNVFVPNVWHGRGTHYPSELAPVDRRLLGRISNGDDPLAYLVKRAHELGIEVHPWFTVVRGEGEIFRQWMSETDEGNAFDVHNEDFRNFIVDLMLDLVRRYDVDGVNLDYIRSMGFCKLDSCSEDYSRKFGRSLKLDLQLRRLSPSTSMLISKWNRDAVTDIVARFSASAKTAKPNLIISIDAHPLNDGLLMQGQDAIAWEKAGLIDVIFNMDYKKNLDVALIARIRAAMKRPSRLITLVSLFDLDRTRVITRDPDTISNYVLQSRELWSGTGLGFYHFKQLKPNQATALRLGVFKQPATPSWRVTGP